MEYNLSNSYCNLRSLLELINQSFVSGVLGAYICAPLDVISCIQRKVTKDHKEGVKKEFTEW